MGVIIVNSIAFLRFKGKMDPKSLVAIDTVPLPHKVRLEFVPLPEESGPYTAIPAVALQLVVNGIPLLEFGETLAKLESAIAKFKDLGLWIDVPTLLHEPRIESQSKLEEGLSTWTITTRME